MYTTKEWIASDLPTPVPKFITGGTAHCEPNNDQQPAEIATVFVCICIFISDYKSRLGENPLVSARSMKGLQYPTSFLETLSNAVPLI